MLTPTISGGGKGKRRWWGRGARAIIKQRKCLLGDSRDRPRASHVMHLSVGSKRKVKFLPVILEPFGTVTMQVGGKAPVGLSRLCLNSVAKST